MKLIKITKSGALHFRLSDGRLGACYESGYVRVQTKGKNMYHGRKTMYQINKMIKYQFPHDENNRIQNLYYDVNIHTIFNKSKLRNLKNKFIKYVNYLINYEKNVIQPKLLELQKIRDDVDRQDQRLTFFYRHNPTLENIEKRK